MWNICVCACVWVLLGAARALPPPRCTAPPEQCRARGFHVLNEYEYIVDGNNVIIEYADSRYLHVTCTSGTLSLDSPSMPRFASALHVSAVTLTACPPPAGSYVRTLAALNVTLLANGTLSLYNLPSATPLNAAHLAGLPPIELLKLSKLTPTLGFLSGLQELRSLYVIDVMLSDDELDQLPAALQTLTLKGTGIARVPESTMRTLRVLRVSDTRTVQLEGAVAPELQLLSLDMPGAEEPALQLPQLKFLTLMRARAEVASMKQCGKLRELHLSLTRAKTLPSDWLAACPQLRKLEITRAPNITVLPRELFRNLTELEFFTLKFTNISTLPMGTYENLKSLKYLDLSHNKLKTLPRDLFSSTRALTTLDLSFNDLDAAVLPALGALHSLQTLRLDANTRLGDDCTGGPGLATGRSHLRDLKNLSILSMRNTGVSLICRDWRENMPKLTTLDLSQTKISTLTHRDLQYLRTAPNALVILSGVPVIISYTRSNYEAVLQDSRTQSQATVVLDAERPTLNCSCSLYWAVLALRSQPPHAHVTGLVCGDASRPDLRGKWLRDIDIEDFLCDAPDLCDGTGCACGVRPDARLRTVVRMSCEGAALTRMPPLPKSSNFNVADATYELILANNNISKLSYTDLPPNLRVLDLQNNSLMRIDAETVTKLVVKDRKLLLGGNPLACDCAAAPLLSALSRRREDDVVDYRALRCPDGEPLTAEPRPPCAAHSSSSPLAAALVAALGAILAAALVLAACLARPELRLRVKVFLLRRGWLPRVADPTDDNRPFDAFVSFSHQDEAFVKELVARLEGGPAPYRLCLHYRDWTPGRAIPEQISESVAASRRTLVVVSRHFLKESKWARAEFREAHAHALVEVTPRLVVVLLEEPGDLPLDTDLRRYVARNTYVRWGDPYFWEKLQLALPTPRSPVPQPPPPPSPPYRSVSISTSSLRNDSGFCEERLRPDSGDNSVDSIRIPISTDSTVSKTLKCSQKQDPAQSFSSLTPIAEAVVQVSVEGGAAQAEGRVVPPSAPHPAVTQLPVAVAT